MWDLRQLAAENRFFFFNICRGLDSGKIWLWQLSVGCLLNKSFFLHKHLGPFRIILMFSTINGHSFRNSSRQHSCPKELKSRQSYRQTLLAEQVTKLLVSLVIEHPNKKNTGLKTTLTQLRFTTCYNLKITTPESTRWHISDQRCVWNHFWEIITDRPVVRSVSLRGWSEVDT